MIESVVRTMSADAERTKTVGDVTTTIAVVEKTRIAGGAESQSLGSERFNPNFTPEPVSRGAHYFD